MMNRSAIIAGLVGTVIAGVVLALPHYGVALPLPLMLGLAVALATGAVFAILTATVFGKTPAKPQGKSLLNESLSSVRELIDFFPAGDGVQTLSIRPETSIQSVDTALHPEKYAGKKIVMQIRGGGANEIFNPIKLKAIFAGLAGSPDFEHVLLFDEDKEFLAYIPGPVARMLFTAEGAESNIAQWIVSNFDAVKRKDVYLQIIGGAVRTDTVFSHEKISTVVDRLKGGFRQLVVLDGRSLKRPVGIIHAEKMIEILTRAGVPPSGMRSGAQQVEELKQDLRAQ
jgi:hypothetical protein